MKKYGIETVSRDDTPGFRSTDITVKWYDSETERDLEYERLTRKRTLTLDDLVCSYYGDAPSDRYSKIEE